MDLKLSCSVPLFHSVLPFTVLVILLLFRLKPVEGQFQLIGSLEPIVAAPGDDVVLRCHVEPPLNVARLTVEWSRPDLQDQQRGVEYVHLYRYPQEVPDMKMASYVRRTVLFEDDLRQGNISLKIMNVTLADEGRFRCFLPKLKSRVQSSTVRLVVKPKTWTTETPPQTTSRRTPDPREEMDGEAGLSSRNRLIPIVCVFLMILGVGGVAVHSKQECQKQELLKVPAV